MQYVGIDLSLTSTGLAVQRDGQAITTGVITTKALKVPGHASKLARFRSIALEIRQRAFLFRNLEAPPRVFLEGPSYGSAGAATHDMAGNWWGLYGDLQDVGCVVTVIPPAVVKTYATGSGNAKKDHVLAAAIKRYPDIDIPGNDIADAVILLAIGMRIAGHPLEDSLPATHLRALDKLVKP